jgi:hypothetical protein
MKRLILSAAIVLSLSFQTAIGQQPASPASPTAPAGSGKGRVPATSPAVQAKPEELAKIREKTEQIEALVKELKAKRYQPDLTDDVEVFAHAGKMLLEYPEMFGTQAAIEHAFSTLDQGIERGNQLQADQPQWNRGDA